MSQPLLPTPAYIDPVLRNMPEQHIVAVSQGLMANKDIISMWFGEGDLVTPEVVRQAAIEGLQEGDVFYGEKRGRMALRQALQEYHQRTYKVALDIERISGMASGISAIQLIFQAILQAGDNVVLVSPLWPNAAAIVELRHAETRYCELERHGHSFVLDKEHLFSLIDDNTKAVFINSPGNPTGWVLGDSDMQEILQLARQKRFWIIADEVYNRVTFDGVPAPSFVTHAEADDPVIIVNSFSKSWAMTGWRLGWLIHPPILSDEIGKLVEFNYSCSPGFVQRGGIAALQKGEDFIAQLCDHCRHGRDITIQALSQLRGVDRIMQPQAGFYAYFHLDYPTAQTDILTFARQIAETAKVGLAPGSSFGPRQEGWLRLCFAQNPKLIAQAFDRLNDYFNSL